VTRHLPAKFQLESALQAGLSGTCWVSFLIKQVQPQQHCTARKGNSDQILPLHRRIKALGKIDVTRHLPAKFHLESALQAGLSGTRWVPSLSKHGHPRQHCTRGDSSRYIIVWLDILCEECIQMFSTGFEHATTWPSRLGKI
jgi:hypothetical protein